MADSMKVALGIEQLHARKLFVWRPGGGGLPYKTDGDAHRFA